MTTDPSSWAIALKRYNCGWANAAANPNCDIHNGYFEIYGHIFPNGIHVSTGQSVQAGQHIADVGENGEATGCHLHFSVWQGYDSGLSYNW